MMLSLEGLGSILNLVSLSYDLSSYYIFSLEAEKGKHRNFLYSNKHGYFLIPLTPTKSQTNLNGYFTIEEMCFL